MPAAELPSSNLPYLFAAFAVAWVVFFAYAFFISRWQSEAHKELQALRRSLEEDATSQGQG